MKSETLKVKLSLSNDSAEKHKHAVQVVCPDIDFESLSDGSSLKITYNVSISHDDEKLLRVRDIMADPKVTVSLEPSDGCLYEVLTRAIASQIAKALPKNCKDYI